MAAVVSDIPVIFFIFIFAFFIGFINMVDAIDCYQCTSIDGGIEECEDTFDVGIRTVHLIKRSCFYGFFKGTHCIKLKGKK
ncbi:uncharacterized protein LOC131954869, partial [Physella acuta]|uniref:uncharacterized protein LOC131954869 n=1 Tax=Physella acuta TaxID=109671 RepID=UPI0027DDCB9E